MAQRWAEAEVIYRGLAAQWPRIPEIHCNLGIAIKNLGKKNESIAPFQAAVSLRPEYVEAWVNLAEVLRITNRLAEAVHAYRRTVTLRPDFAEAWNDLGVTLREIHQPELALEAYRRTVALRPDFAEAWNNMGVVLRLMDRPMEAIDAFRRALALRQDIAQIWSNLSVTLKDTGQLDESLACVDRGIALQPEEAAVYSNRLYTLNFHAGFDDAAIFREVRQWNDRFARPLLDEIRVHANDPSPERRLRVGYVSGDFRRHCQALFTPPLLSHHDHREFEIFCYSAVAVPDMVTARLKRHVDGWRDIVGLDDRAVARLIAQDKIDILVDLTLHMSGHKLKVFAQKPAPVQVTWLGYPGTTGLDAIDYRLSDPRLDPLGSSELEIRNPKSVFDPEAQTRREIRINDQNPNVPISEDSLNHPAPLGHSDIGSLGVDSGFPSGLSLRVEDGFRISDFSTQEPYYSERSVRLPDTFWCYDPTGM